MPLASVSQMHAGVHVREPTAAPRMNRQSLAFGTGPEVTGSEQAGSPPSVVVVDAPGVLVVEAAGVVVVDVAGGPVVDVAPAVVVVDVPGTHGVIAGERR